MKPSKSPNPLQAFAVTAPGLESICAAELSALGVAAATVEEGGVSWHGSLETVARANLWLRTASRVIVRVAEFRARTFFELERHARQVPWDRFVVSGSRVEFRVTCRKSKLYHSGAVAQRLGDAVRRRVAGAVTSVGASKAAADDVDEAADAPAAEVLATSQLFIVRVFHDVCQISVDSSGALLHVRGYRQQLAKAPLRETLAAAVLLGADWRGDRPLVDPMCGSGTIPIEAARLARRIAPGRDREFAFTRWPETSRALLPGLVAEARSQELAQSPVVIEGYDRDAGAIEAAQANARRGGVEADVRWGVQPISALSAADAGANGADGLAAFNPPYGVRIGETDALRNLYAQIGNVLRSRRPGWALAMLSADRGLERQIGAPLHERFRTSNGGIPVRLMTTSAAES